MRKSASAQRCWRQRSLQFAIESSGAVLAMLLVMAGAAKAGECEIGKAVVLDRRGEKHCCWPDQKWSAKRRRCEGPPRCPAWASTIADSCTAQEPTIVKFEASAREILVGESIDLAWSTRGQLSCSLTGTSPNPTEMQPPEAGSLSVQPVKVGQLDLTLTCKGPRGSVLKETISVLVREPQPPPAPPPVVLTPAKEPESTATPLPTSPALPDPHPLKSALLIRPKRHVPYRRWGRVALIADIGSGTFFDWNGSAKFSGREYVKSSLHSDISLRTDHIFWFADNDFGFQIGIYGRLGFYLPRLTPLGEATAFDGTACADCPRPAPLNYSVHLDALGLLRFRRIGIGVIGGTEYWWGAAVLSGQRSTVGAVLSIHVPRPLPELDLQALLTWRPGGDGSYYDIGIDFVAHVATYFTLHPYLLLMDRSLRARPDAGTIDKLLISGGIGIGFNLSWPWLRPQTQK